jgi:hypothetical protein
MYKPVSVNLVPVEFLSSFCPLKYAGQFLLTLDTASTNVLFMGKSLLLHIPSLEDGLMNLLINNPDALYPPFPNSFRLHLAQCIVIVLSVSVFSFS